MRLLLVEDDYLLTNGLSAQLEKAGFSVDTARTAREARHLGQQESYRAGILDLGLPDGNGLDVLKQWRTHKVSFPVLILTARGDWQLYSIDDIPSENVIEAYVRRLRKLVGPDTIKTRRGQGYLFDADSR